jgi:hypothetical protein
MEGVMKDCCSCRLNIYYMHTRKKVDSVIVMKDFFNNLKFLLIMKSLLILVFLPERYIMAMCDMMRSRNLIRPRLIVLCYRFHCRLKHRLDFLSARV